MGYLEFKTPILPCQIVSKKGGRGIERVKGGVNLVKVHYMNEWKYHNKTLWYN
jgi:hypothetical protein